MQFRLAYVAPDESRVVGAGVLVDHPKKIALNYLKGYFLIDFFVVLPLPQVNLCLSWSFYSFSTFLVSSFASIQTSAYFKQLPEVQMYVMLLSLYNRLNTSKKKYFDKISIKVTNVYDSVQKTQMVKKTEFKENVKFLRGDAFYDSDAITCA